MFSGHTNKGVSEYLQIIRNIGAPVLWPVIIWVPFFIPSSLLQPSLLSFPFSHIHYFILSFSRFPLSSLSYLFCFPTPFSIFPLSSFLYPISSSNLPSFLLLHLSPLFWLPIFFFSPSFLLSLFLLSFTLFSIPFLIFVIPLHSLIVRSKCSPSSLLGP